ncbi:MAG: AraC family transcriptional regulator [Verrucomicrobiota bacterium]
MARNISEEQAGSLHAEDRPTVYHDILAAEIDMPLIINAGYRVSPSAYWHEPHTFEGNLFVYFLEGSASTVLLESGEVLTSPGGTFYSLPPGIAHCPSSDNFEPHTTAWLLFSPPSQKAVRNTTITLEEYQTIFQSLSAAGPGVHTTSAHLRDILDHFVSLIAKKEQENDPFSPLAMRTLICNILIETLACIRGLEPPPDTFFSQAIQAYIENHYEESIQIRDMAEHMGYDETWFKKRFKREIGFTPNHYLQRYRINRAKEFLQNTDQTITDIALQVGFESSQYFSHVFKKLTGVTPRQYRTTAPRK